MKEVTIILPALNEEQAIGKVIDEIKALPLACDIIVADNGSSDSTVDEATRRDAYVNKELRKGKGNTIRAVLGLVNTPFVIMMDADFTYPAPYIIFMLDILKTQGIDAVIGHRKLKMPNSMSLANRIGNSGLSLLASMLYGYRMKDVCSGLWGFRTDALNSFLLTSTGFTLEAELFISTIKRKCRIEQIPIAYRARLDGSKPKLKISDGLSIGWFLIKRRFTRR